MSEDSPDDSRLLPNVDMAIVSCRYQGVIDEADAQESHEDVLFLVVFDLQGAQGLSLLILWVLRRRV